MQSKQAVEVVNDQFLINNKPIEEVEVEEESGDESNYSGLESEPDTSDEEADGDDENGEADSEDNAVDDTDDEVEDAEDGKDGRAQVVTNADDTVDLAGLESDDDTAATNGTHEADSSDNEDNSDGISIRVGNNDEQPRGDKVKLINGTPVYQAEFEDVDTSDEEDIRNTVGNIPMECYNYYKHIGYNLKGKRILKPEQNDQLDDFLSKMDDPDYWRTVYDKTNMKNIKLSEEDVDTIQRMQSGKFPEASFDPYEDYVDWATGEKMLMPIKDNPEKKSSFCPSKWEHKKVMRIVRAIKNGWIKPKTSQMEDTPEFYLLWSQDDKSKDHPMHWPAPKLKLPGHEESYNPPPEYLPTQQERDAWEAKDPEDREQRYLSRKYDALRKVPGYQNFIQEKFERCLDLYLCPRQRKVRLQVDPESLIPKLPRPRDLQPFPTQQSIIYKGHKQGVHCVSVDPTGEWLASGGGDSTIRFWEVSTGRCMKIVPVSGTVTSVAWNPSTSLPILAATVEEKLLVLNPHLGDKLLCTSFDNRVFGFTPEKSDQEPVVKWSVIPKKDNSCIRLHVVHDKPIRKVEWHAKGDYLATVCPKSGHKSVLIHQLSRQKSQCPFKKSKGEVQCVSFHPTRPIFFVATQQYIRVYNLQKQELIKKLTSGVRWISSIAMHPQGDNLIVGSYDKRLAWFDMDLSSKPYKTLRHHKKAVRGVAYHKSYPLFASASDDGSVIVCHGMVYSDLMQNPLIVPLKILRGHHVTNDYGVLDCQFHPTQPWIFTAGADSTIRLFT